MNHIWRLLGWKVPLIFVIFLGLVFFAASCKNNESTVRDHTKDPLPVLPNLDKPIESVKDSSEKTKTIGDKVEKSATTIEKNATNIEKNTPDASKPKVQPDIDSIKNETGELKKDSNELKVISQRLKDTEKTLGEEKANVTKWMDYAKDADKTNEILNAKIAELQEENNQQLKKMLSYVIVICVIGLGIWAIAALVAPSKLILWGGAGLLVTMFAALGVSFFMKSFAIGAMIVLGASFLAVVGYLAWQFHIRNKAELELIQTNEVAKQNLLPEVREKLFGYGAETGKVDQIQSTSTKNRVKQIRNIAVEKGLLKLAPRIPEYWRPPENPQVRIVDPYAGVVLKRTETII